jgi:hypothetical protein
MQESMDGCVRLNYNAPHKITERKKPCKRKIRRRIAPIARFPETKGFAST